MEKLKPRDIIGNTVTLAHESNNPIVTILAASPERIAYEMNGEILHGSLSQALGIPITAGWLLGFGFERDIVDNDESFISPFQRKTLMIQKFDVTTDKDDIDWHVLYQDDIGCGYNPLNYIEYIHQLENIYYNLTGEELEFKTT